MSSAKNSYSTLSDDILAELSNANNEEAYNELVLRYFGKIGFIARKYSAQGYEQNDFVQEGLLGLLYAVKTFDKNGGMSFKSYVSLVVERRFISIIRRQSAKKNVPNSALLHFEELDCDTADTALTPEELFMLREQTSLVTQRLAKVLSKREYEALMLYAEGMSYSKIAARLGISEKSVDNALQRARKKIGGFIDMS